MISFLAILTLVAQACVVFWVLLRVVELGTRTRSRPLDAIAAMIANEALKLAWLVAVVAVAGSLYMSEKLHFIPCMWCWYQRIMMYPLVIVLGVAALRKDFKGGYWYAIPFTLIGSAFSVYHYQLERFPDQKTISCSTSVPCTTLWFEDYFGYISIPMMAMSAFALIAVILTTARRYHGQGITNEA